MNVSSWVWAGTLVALTAMLLVDLLIIGRRPHEPSLRESTLWVIFYVGLAALFGAGVGLRWGATYAGQFFAGWVTEYSLSVDNLFVFVIIMSRFAVPRAYQQKVLLIGIVLALVMRGAFIAAGAALVSRFVWVFYVFGAFLIYTAVNLARQREQEADDVPENIVIKWSRRVLPLSRTFDGARMTTVGPTGRRLFTPMLVVMIAIGTTDLIFALDSIPAIFGLTHKAYLVFAANVFALMGLRQLYFLIGGLLTRLVYLSMGLAVVLGFIGVKLVLEALADNNVPFINGGDHVGWAPHIPIWLSLSVIIGTLLFATLASMAKTARDRRLSAAAAVVGAAVPEVATIPDTAGSDAAGSEGASSTGPGGASSAGPDGASPAGPDGASPAGPGGASSAGSDGAGSDGAGPPQGGDTTEAPAAPTAVVHPAVTPPRERSANH